MRLVRFVLPQPHHDRSAEVTEPKTVAEQLDAAKDGQEFAQVILGLFGALERMSDDDDDR